MYITKEGLRFLREQYPAGTRIRLHELMTPDADMAPGLTGLLTEIDDSGVFHVQWENGASTGLAFGEDSFSAVPPEPHRLKLWMNLTADFVGRNEWNEPVDDEIYLDGSELWRYASQIRKALENHALPEEQERGFMHWYREDNGVNRKVERVVFTVEERNRRLWCVADCTIRGELTPEELDQLKDYVSGQASDGWGKGFEQHAIRISGGDLYIHLWNAENWDILTENERFSEKVAPGLPKACLSVHGTTGELILLVRGERGYYSSSWNTGSREKNVEQADKLNACLHVTPAQRQAMEVGSMFGWDLPGADPHKYEDCREQFEPEQQYPDESGSVMSM